MEQVKVNHKMTKKENKFLYEAGDLVELARYGIAPSRDEDRVYGTVISALEPTDYYVPRYKVRIQYMKIRSRSSFDDYILDSYDGNIITVMEYDIAGKVKRETQE